MPRETARPDVPVVVGGPSRGHAELAPGSIALGRDDPIPGLGRQGVAVALGADAPEPCRHPRDSLVLTAGADAATERLQARLVGDPHLPRHLVGALVHLPMELTDRRDDPEAQE